MVCGTKDWFLGVIGLIPPGGSWDGSDFMALAPPSESTWGGLQVREVLGAEAADVDEVCC